VAELDNASRLTSKHTLIIVGGGMAAHALCREVSRAKVEERPRIVMIGEERLPAYNRVRLSEVMGGLDPAALELSPRAFYHRHEIALHLDDAVVAIDREAQRVRTASGRVFDYDALVLATGSEPRRPPIPGIDGSGCHVYRSLRDLEELRHALSRARSGAVIGGGLLGLEAAGVLHERGLGVQIVETGSGLMPRQLDAASGRCLQAHVERLGLRVHVGRQVVAVERDAAGLRLCFDNRESLSADLVVVAAGIRPRDELARACGLRCNVRGGVAVDDVLRSSDPRIYAVGECASVRGTCYGLLRPCLAMAQALGKHLLGAPATFGDPDQSCRLKLLGVEVAALGDYGNEHQAVAVDVREGRRTLLLEGSTLVGAVAVGPWHELPRVQHAIAEQASISARQLERFARGGALFRDRTALPVTAWPDRAVLCNCAQVEVGEIRARLQAGACDPAQLAACTGVTTGCGSCKPLLGVLLGDAVLAASRARTFGLPALSLFALALAVLSAGAAPIEFAESVSDAVRAVDRLWRERWLKQITGFGALALTALGFVLTLRKRGRWPRFGELNLYRALHALLGALTLLALIAHTGFRLGDNLNLLLIASFLGASVFGSALGLASSLESRARGLAAIRARRLRPYVTLLHILLVWPLPVLIGLHVLAVYYF
jgi:nitrite reductase (NADH) large subunit